MTIYDEIGTVKMMEASTAAVDDRAKLYNDDRASSPMEDVLNQLSRELNLLSDAVDMMGNRLRPVRRLRNGGDGEPTDVKRASDQSPLHEEISSCVDRVRHQTMTLHMLAEELEI